MRSVRRSESVPYRVRCRMIPLVTLGLFGVASSVQGQEASAETRLRVRIVKYEEPGRPQYVVGRLVRLNGDTAVTDPGGLFVLDERTRLEQSLGQQRKGFTGLAVGGAVGMVVGAIVGAAVWHPTPCEGFGCVVPDVGRAGSAVAGGIVGSIVGGWSGYLVGSAIHGERWRRVRSGELKVAVGPGGIGLRLTF
jgi:hypothetical protein